MIRLDFDELLIELDRFGIVAAIVKLKGPLQLLGMFDLRTSEAPLTRCE
jgi:hypothetical protein